MHAVTLLCVTVFLLFLDNRNVVNDTQESSPSLVSRNISYSN